MASPFTMAAPQSAQRLGMTMLFLLCSVGALGEDSDLNNNCLAGGVRACGEDQVEAAEETLTAMMRTELLQINAARFARNSKALGAIDASEAVMASDGEVQDEAFRLLQNQSFGFGSSAQCGIECQWEPQAVWQYSTDCCACGGQTCPACACTPDCHYQPSGAWYTQTRCCGCHSLAQIKTQEKLISRQDANEDSVALQNQSFGFGSNAQCGIECQWEPQAVWQYSTDCCACGGQTCPTCACTPDCQYQPSGAWYTQTRCCGCHSLAQIKIQEKLIGRQDAKEDSVAAQNQSFGFGSSAQCGIECQWEPQAVWQYSTDCCACGGHTCPACACAPDCQYQPSGAWYTQTRCCGCHSLAQIKTQANLNSRREAANEDSVALQNQSFGFGSSAQCGIECQWEPQAVWQYSTDCCACGGQTCPTCACTPDCHYQPSGAWYTQTRCCGCHSLAQIKTQEKLIGRQDAKEDSVAQQNQSFGFGSSAQCGVECQWEPQAVWQYSTDCCACGGQTCPVCACAPDCQYQPSGAWYTQTRCCGCHSLAQIKTQQKLVGHEDANEDSVALQNQSFGFGSSAQCGIECQWEPQAVWQYSTDCCACGGQTCPTCACTPDCQYQPSGAWYTQTRCCGCHSLAQFKTQEKLDQPRE